MVIVCSKETSSSFPMLPFPEQCLWVATTKVSAASYPSSPCAANLMAGVRLDQYPSLVIQVGVVVPIGLGLALNPLAMSS